MGKFGEIWRRVVMLARRDAAARELAEEMGAHREMKERELIAGGADSDEARYAASRSFGNAMSLSERGRQAWDWRWLEDFAQDLQFGARVLRKNPGFTATAVLTLALGIGVNTAIFSVVDAVLLKPLPYRDADRLVAVWFTEVGHPGTKIFAPYRDFQEFRAHSRSFEELSAVTWARAGEILSWHGSAHSVLAIPADVKFFDLLGASAAEGRTFSPEDLHAGCTVVLADAFWRGELGGVPAVVGSALTLNGKSCVVAGVMPRGFDFYPKSTSLWTLITPDSAFFKDPLESVIGIFGRLNPGVTLANAESEMAALHQSVKSEAPAGNWVGHIAPIVRDMREQFTWLAGRNLRTTLLVLSAAVTFVLLIACVNVANLVLGRAAGRQRELAMRGALGSSRFRLMRQLLTESLLIAVLGSGLGTMLALAGVGYFDSANMVELPPGNRVAIDLRVLGFTMAVATATSLLFGLMPAWRMSRIDLNEMLKQTSGSLARRREGWASWLLVVGEMALSLVLLAVSGLLIVSLVRLGAAPLGFRTDHLVTAKVALPPGSYTTLGQRSTLYENLNAKFAALPGAEGVALASSLPPYGGRPNRLSVAGKPFAENVEAIAEQDVSASYFGVLGIPLLQGRPFESRDRENSQQVAIVNQELLRRYFDDEDPVGKQIKLGRPESEAPWLTVVGVVGNEKRGTVYQEMGYVDQAFVYRPLRQAAGLTMEIAIRHIGETSILENTLQAETSRLDREVPVFDFKTMDDRYSEAMAHPRFRTVLMTALAGLALALAAIGIYGVLAQRVSQRTAEIGIRMALGASRRAVLWMVLNQAGRQVFGGIALGVAAGLTSAKLIASMLFGVSPTNAATFGGVSLLLAVVALIACYVPARRAMRVDPMTALKHE
jgi:predicted permease